MQTYTLDQVKQQLSEYPDWVLDEEKQKIYTGFEFDNFDQAVDFLNAVTELAAEVKQNPDLYLYDSKYLQIFVGTVQDKFTEAGFELIEAIDELFAEIDGGESDEEDEHSH